MDINKKEFKSIIDAINNLTPWDKNDIISYIGCEMDNDDTVIETARNLGMVFPDEVDDLVDEKINDMTSFELLENCDSSDIVDWVLDDDEMTIDVIRQTTADNVAKGIGKSYYYSIGEILNILLKYTGYKKIINEWFDKTKKDLE